MKKSIVAGAALVAALGLVACTEEAKADATVYGSLEQRLEITDGVSNINGDTDGNYVGVKVSEDLGEGSSAFANISIDVDTEGNNGATTRDAYVGLSLNGVNVKAGRMPNATKAHIDEFVDVFEGTSFSANGSAYGDSAVAVSTELNGLTVGVSAVADNGNQNGIDTYSAVAKADLGAFRVTGLYTKNQTTGADTKSVGAATDLGALTLAGTYELDSADVATTTLVATTTVGSNTFKGGIEKVESGDQTYIAEAVHNFTKNTAAYVNYTTDDNSTTQPTTMIGMRVQF